MHAVIRRYSGRGASQLSDELERNTAEIERIIRGVRGFVAYSLIRTGDGGVTVTVCQDKAGADESVRVAADWVRQNTTAAANPPEVSDGPVLLQLS
jgi:hypothetical protein